MCFSLNVFAQVDIKSVKRINFYGVDFSHANLYGLKEYPDDIKNGLERINYLFTTEKKKYDIGKYFQMEEVFYCLETTDERNSRLSIKKMLSNKEFIELNDSQILETISGLDCDNNECGLVLIAENLNKKDEKATYLVVFFDGETKEIIYSKRSSGRALGIGVRNHWAGSIYGLMKNWKY